jgi:tetratricopeptide (TPR) repeat protein
MSAKAPPAERSGRWAAAAAAALAAMVVLIYGRVAGFPFVWFDDNHYVLENPFVRAGLTLRGLRWAFLTDDGNYWHPLAFVSHMLDVQLFGLHAGAHHLVSAGLHLANALLLFSLLRALTRDTGRSAFVAAVFAAHPLQVESVAWVAERKTVLAAFLLLAALRAYASWARRGGARLYAAALACFALSLAAKPLGVALPALLLLLEYWPLARLRARPLFCLKAAAPFAALALASAALTRATARFVSPVPLSARLLNTPVFLVRYLGKAAWPSSLSVFYPYPDAPASPALAGGCLAALLALTWAAARSSRRSPAALAGWLWFLACLLPVSGVVAVGAHSIADRFMYLPLAGLALAVAWLAPLRGRAAAAAAAACVCALAAASAARVGDWRDGVSLFSAAARVQPASALVRMQLGFALFKDGRLPEAEDEYRKALELRPDYAEARQYLGVDLAAEGRLEEAAAQLRRALDDAPRTPLLRAQLESVEAELRRRGGGRDR